MNKRTKQYDFLCKYCGKPVGYDKLRLHYNHYHSQQVSLYEYANCVFCGELEQAVQLYKQGFSINELVQDKKNALFKKIPRKILECVLKDMGIYRGLNESNAQQRRINKYREYCRSHYGVENVSQLQQVKEKKAQTFIRNYGVDNIWKCDWYSDFQSERMIELYGKKRVSGYDGKTEQEKYQINKKRLETRERHGFYDSSLEERVERILKTHNIKYVRQFFAFHHPYDFLLGEIKNRKLLEINGDYWHANPKIYKSTDVFCGGKTAQQIWDRDRKFEECLIGTKWTVKYLWEFDMKKMSDDDILFFI